MKKSPSSYVMEGIFLFTLQAKPFETRDSAIVPWIQHVKKCYQKK